MRYYKDKNGSVIATSGELNIEEITKEEYESINAEVIKRIQDSIKLTDKYVPMSVEEVSRMLIANQINTLNVDDQTALRMIAFYPAWEDLAAKSYTAENAGFKFVHAEKLYKTRQEKHTFSSALVPGEGTESIYERIDEVHDGSKYDPIPYDGNMALENGKYYSQDGVKYICTRDSVNPVYHALADLVGLYVEIATE